MPTFILERYRGRRRMQVALVAAPDADIVREWAALSWPGDEAVMSGAPSMMLVTRETVDRLRFERTRPPAHATTVTGSTELVFMD